ncbi:MAG: shikimate kinase [Clostridiales bacterium]|nr:shikimate kinase [Clostridiales bacterium]
MDNIILIGMPATGKSTVGVVLAKLIGYDFIDVDILISKEQGRPLSRIIAEEGYERFIEIEGKVGAGLRCEKTVVATGGSMVFSEAAMKNLSSLGKLVWIDSPLAELEKRVSGSLEDRGVAAPENMTMGQIFDLRRPLYEKYADIKIDGRGNAETVVSLIRERLSI